MNADTSSQAVTGAPEQPGSSLPGSPSGGEEQGEAQPTQAMSAAQEDGGPLKGMCTLLLLHTFALSIVSVLATTHPSFKHSALVEWSCKGGVARLVLLQMVIAPTCASLIAKPVL